MISSSYVTLPDNRSSVRCKITSSGREFRMCIVSDLSVSATKIWKKDNEVPWSVADVGRRSPCLLPGNVIVKS